MIKRSVDLILAMCLGLISIVPLLIIAAVIKLTSPGPAIYWSNRVGRDNHNFFMPKFRTMRIDTPAVATHLLTSPEKYITPVGAWLRRYSLDELPQIWSVIKGDMSMVGPRPALYNQDDLVALRTECGVAGLVPGLTGWAQVNGRDELPIPDKVAFDAEYLRRRSLVFDAYILWLTLVKAARGEAVTH